MDEAASIDVLCADKTGTLTQNELTVTAVHAMQGFDEARVLALAAMASSDGGQDSVDIAIRAAASKRAVADPLKLDKFVPFDPATKMSEATAKDGAGATVRVVKGFSGREAWRLENRVTTIFPYPFSYLREDLHGPMPESLHGSRHVHPPSRVGVRCPVVFDN